MKLVNVIVDNKTDAIDTPFTYSCPDHQAVVGQKVTVPFGMGNKPRAGFIIDIQQERPKENKEDEAKKKKIRIKEISSIDENITLTEEMVKTGLWMKNRYFCRYFEALNLFVPVGGPSKRGIREIPHKDNQGEAQKIVELTAEQKKALKEIDASIENKQQDIYLLHGVTGSGKTEVYIRAIDKVVNHERDKGFGAIMLVPEIALTKQVIDRFIYRFGKERIAILHSKLTRGQRYDEWKRIKAGQVDIVIGARSGIFAPLKKIGIIILDEEHETTYKSDKTPKYETVELAIKRTKPFGGTILLGSATPSIVSFQRAKEGIYKYISMKERYNKVKLPSVEIVSMQEEIKKGNRTVVSKALYEEIAKTLDSQKQVILFLNRRGYSTFLSCEECDYIAKCPHCEISLTYHKEENRLVCHYCGKKEKPPNVCPKCGSKKVSYSGYGTEKVEEQVGELFPEAKIERLDLDTTKRKGVVEKTLSDFGKGKIDILTGTQIVAKGLDFKNVGLVGIISADTALNIPDFRSTERCFQLITQAAGRAGRGEEEGKVIIQTYTPENYAIAFGSEQNYEGFFETEIKLREYMQYPPYTDLVQMIVSSKNQETSKEEADFIKKSLVSLLGEKSEINIFEPQEMTSIVKEVKKNYVLVKCPREEKSEYMGAIKAIKENFNKIKEESRNHMENTQLSIDINPYTMWRG